jgi:hypothetical protein
MLRTPLNERTDEGTDEIMNEIICGMWIKS